MHPTFACLLLYSLSSFFLAVYAIIRTANGVTLLLGLPSQWRPESHFQAASGSVAQEVPLQALSQHVLRHAESPPCPVSGGLREDIGQKFHPQPSQDKDSLYKVCGVFLTGMLGSATLTLLFCWFGYCLCFAGDFKGSRRVSCSSTQEPLGDQNTASRVRDLRCPQQKRAKVRHVSKQGSALCHVYSHIVCSREPRPSTPPSLTDHFRRWFCYLVL